MLLTPDLSKSFNPIPKPTKKEKAKPKAIAPGKKVETWNTVRAELKIRFERAGIVECELHFANCWKNNALTFAHLAKRRELKEGELEVVCLACTPCHQEIEYLPHAEMRAIIEKVIKERKIQP